LVLIDVGLPNDHIETLLSYLTQKRLQIACVLLVDTIRQKWVGEALGADKVLIKGFTALELSDAIATLLSVKSKKSVGDNS
jgi:DNA-binding NarL/FixJ family response regulator